MKESSIRFNSLSKMDIRRPNPILKKNIKEDYISRYRSYFVEQLVILDWKVRISVPKPLVIFLGTYMAITVTLHAYLYASSVNWFNKCSDYGFVVINCTGMSIAYQYRDIIIKLNKTMADCGGYKYLDEETEKVEQEGKQWLERFNFLYISSTFFGGVAYITFPFGRYLFKGTREPMDLLIYPCWSPLPIDTYWGFIATYVIESITIFVSFYSFSRVIAYKTICFITIGHQMKLISIALQKVESRVMKITGEHGNLNAKNHQRIYLITLDKEIKLLMGNFLTLLRTAKHITDLFKPMTSVNYHFGMWVLCSNGVKIATEENFIEVLQAFLMLGAVLKDQYIYSILSESLASEMEKLRNEAYFCPWYNMPIPIQKSVLLMLIASENTPYFTTFLGTKTNMENFSKIINGSYYYTTTLSTMATN